VPAGPAVYVLESSRNGRFYIGCSSDVNRRLAEHNSGKVRATRYLAPWQLLFVEPCSDMTAARRREQQLKKLKSRAAIIRLIASVGWRAPMESGRSLVRVQYRPPGPLLQRLHRILPARAVLSWRSAARRPAAA